MRRAAELTPEPRRRAERALAAAWASEEAGAPEVAGELLATAVTGPLGELERARASLLRAQIAFTSNRGNLAPPLLLEAARQLEPLDTALSREAYLQTLSAAMFAGRLAPGGGLLDIAAAARAAPPPSGSPGLADLLLDAVAQFTSERAKVAAPAMQRALRASLSSDIAAEDDIRWLWLSYGNAVAPWDDEAARLLADRHVRLARDTGALSVLPLALSSRIIVHLFEGELDEAEALSAEVDTITTATAIQVTNYGALALSAWRGREPEAAKLIRASRRQARARGEGVGLTVVQWVRAILYNSLGRYDEARVAAQEASADPPAQGAARQWAPVELVEAAARSGALDRAHQALEQVVETTEASSSDWARGIEARSRALLSRGQDAEVLYREAIDRLGRTRLRSETARAYRLAAVGTSSAESARAASDAFGVPGHAVLSDLLAQPDVDLVTIAVKATRSSELVTQALASGKPVYHEWPLGGGTAEAERLAQAAADAGVRTVVGLQGRYDPVVTKVRELVAEGYLGTVVATSMRAAGVSWGHTTTPASAYLFDAANGVTPLSVTAVHALDTMTSVLGEPTWLTADLSAHPGTVEIAGRGSVPSTVARHVAVVGRIGAVPLVLEVDGGPARGDGLTWTITGTEGQLVISSPSPNGNIQATNLELRGGRGDEPGLSRLTVPADGLPAGPAGNVARLYAAFAQDLRTGTRTVPDFAQAVERHRLVDTLLQRAGDLVPVGA